MATSKVSPSFTKFLAKNSEAVKHAKEAENTMQTCAMPIGWKGQVICVDAVADKGKDRKDDKGNVVEGRDFIRLEFSVVNDSEYQGKKAAVVWVFFDTDKATSMDRFEWCLNELENLGLPREVRQGFNDISEVLEHFSNGDEVFEAEVVENKFRRGDQKELKVRRHSVVDNTTSMAPPSADHKSAQSSSKSTLTIGQDVKYMGKSWELVDQDGDTIVVKSKATGTNRTIKITDLEG